MDCPFVYANGKKCKGKIERIEAYHCACVWDPDTGEVAIFPGSHFHLFCSLKGNHAGYLRRDDERMKFWPQGLPDEIAKKLIGIGCPAPEKSWDDAPKIAEL